MPGGKQPNAAGTSAVGVSHALRGDGRDREGAADSPGQAQSAELAAGAPAVDVSALFRQHYAELVRLAVMLLGDRPAAEDVVQDVFARLHTRRDRPGPRGDQLWPMSVSACSTDAGRPCAAALSCAASVALGPHCRICRTNPRSPR